MTEFGQQLLAENYLKQMGNVYPAPFCSLTCLLKAALLPFPKETAFNHPKFAVCIKYM
jgi:hypothetical protein